ncbi:hypothetical protein GCM10009847_03610 [Leucobacter tardus]|uniref:Uncharacterized protein n=1 Tax=Leucobacter tardus TaxID=501483 RepID=A0A939QIZ1_9MICO|nr:hypothetical protein [Leucobacter tardus]MBO2988569.1 hypothetical protein [Leucobacter tardus]
MNDQQHDRRDPDATSDPARSDETGADWADEGGATPEGPATAESATENSGSSEGRPEDTGGIDAVAATAEEIPSTPIAFDPPA